MNLKEIETREIEIREKLQGDVSLDDLNDLEKEVENLKQERKAIEETLEKRQALIDATLRGEGTPLEMPKETRKMEIEKLNDVRSEEYRSAYLAVLQDKATAEQRTAVSAAAVIPTITLNKIYEKLEQASILFPYISKSYLKGNVSIPVENAKNDAAWVAMGTAATDSADSFAAVSLSAYKLIKTVEMTADNLNSSVDAFESFIVDPLVKKMARAVDAAICTGDGSSKATGLLASGVITNTGTYTKLGMTFADLVTIIGDLGAEYRKNAKFVMPSAVFFSDVVPALASKGIGVDVQLGLKYQILGHEVILDDNMSADSIVFGDLSYYHWNFAQDVEIARDNSVGFRTGSAVYRAMALADGKVVNAAAFNHYTRAAS
jgi:HK97 family phage major capsid protein